LVHDSAVRFGIFLPPFREFAEPGRVIELTVAAEQAGWDGVFLWDHMLAGPGVPIADPWITMAGIAVATKTLRLGAMVTPLPRRRPWVLARQVATLDRLSRGRLILGVGLGDDGWREFSSFGEETDPVVRGHQLDESLELVQKLLQGLPVQHRGGRYAVDTTAFLPTPAQSPFPIWAAGRWPNRRPLARAAGLQGFFPIFAPTDPPAPPSATEVATISRKLKEQGIGPGFDLVVTWPFTDQNPAGHSAAVDALEAAGATWCLDGYAPTAKSASELEVLFRKGPPPNHGRGRPLS
jgi:alkanesulfonate monooxygenase SsuD/methylene tetrahydromethanopterin reductase-like flavin-dependent oxidoreductase (luciferase family)